MADNDGGGGIPAEMNGPTHALKSIAGTLSVSKTTSLTLTTTPTFRIN